MLGTLYQFTMVIGILLSNILGAPMGTPSMWRFLLALTIGPALLQLLLAPFLLESPRWLVAHGRHDEAHQALSTLRGDVSFALKFGDIDLLSRL